MPSREFRRAKQKSSSKDNIVEKKRATQPLLYGFSVILLIIIAVTFIGGPALSSGGPRGTITFGIYKGEPVEFYPGNYLSRQKDLIADQVRQAGESEDLEAQAYKVWRGAFDQTVLHMAILMEADTSKVWVSKDGVDQILLKTGPYIVGGEFSEERYLRTPKAEHYANEKLYREQLIHEQYLRDVIQEQRMSTRETAFFGTMVERQRKFAFVSFSFTDFPEEQMLSYGEENRDRFRKIKLSRILVKSSEAEAKEIRAKLEERTSSFEELARAHSKDLYADQGGDMGWRFFYDLEGDFDSENPVQEIFALSEGQLSAVIESRFGWVIYRCDSPALDPDLEEPDTLQIVADYVMKYEKGLVEDYYLSRAQVFIERAQETSLVLAALESGMLPSSTEYFPLNYQGIYFMAPVRTSSSGQNLSSASYNRDFFEQAFAILPGQISEPILLDDQILIMQLEDERRAPLEEMDLIEDYYRYYANQSLQTDLQTALVDSEDLEDNFNDVFYQYIFATR